MVLGTVTTTDVQVELGAQVAQQGQAETPCNRW